MIKTRCVTEPAEPGDGLRLLVARFRGRGLAADCYDVWMASLGPSERLLRSFLDGKVTWKDFSRGYKEELFAASTIDDRNKTIRNRGQLHSLRLIKHLAQQGDVTLMCHCHKDTSECHRFLLKDIIESKQV